MSCFNALANCCPPPDPPPENCCLELSDVSTLFPNGVTLTVGGVTFSFSSEGWIKSGCCLSNLSLSSSGSAQMLCTSDWTYEATEGIKCIEKFEKIKRIIVQSPGTPIEQLNLCDYAQCPDIFIGTIGSSSTLEKGERVVTSQVRPVFATLVIGKYLRTCAYGQSVCTYVVGVTITYGISAGAKIQGYKTYNQSLEYIHPDIVNYCHDGMTEAEIKANFDQSFTTGSNDFPLCNYVDTDFFYPQTYVTITRGKLMTNFNCPITFTKDDVNLDFCNWTALCIEPGGEQGPITITFNRTLPPVYIGINPYMLTFDLYECCTTHIIDTAYNPPFAWSVFGPAKRQVGGYWVGTEPPPGQQVITGCFPSNPDFSCIGYSSCYGIIGGCYIPWPIEGTLAVGPWQCCPDQVTIGNFATILPYSKEFSDYYFNYNSVTDTTPIVHTYNIPAWTLNC